MNVNLLYHSFYEWMATKFGKGITYLREISKYAKNNASENTIQQVIDVVSRVRDYFAKHDITK